MPTYSGTAGASMVIVQTIAISVGRSDIKKFSTRSEYEVRNLVVCETSEPPNRFV